MMLLFLTSLLSVVFFAVYRLIGRDILSPAIVYVGMYVISTFVALVNTGYWKVDITGVTVLVITTGVLAFCMGSWFAYRPKKRKVFEYAEETLVLKRAPRYVILGYSIFSLVVYVLLIVKETSRYASSDTTGLTSAGMYREALVSGAASVPVSMTIIATLSAVVALFSLAVLIKGFVNKTPDYKLILPVVSYGVIILLSSNRINFMYLIGCSLVYYYIFMRRSKKVMDIKKLSIIGLASMVAFIMIFLLSGMVTGKTQRYEKFTDGISIYTGSSIVAFDDYLKNNQPGLVKQQSETMYGLDNLKKRIGIDSDSADSSRFLEFRQIGEMPARTNIYTSLRRLHHDYGYVGMILIQMIMGYVATRLYIGLISGGFKNVIFAILIYGFIFQGIITSSFDEKILVNLFTVTTCITFGLYYLLSKALNAKRREDEF